MLKSVRLRLTLYYTAALTLVLLVLAVSTYALLKSDTQKRTDSDIVQLADSFLSTVQAELQGDPHPDSIKLAVSEAIAEHGFQDYSFGVFNLDGSLIGSSPVPQGNPRRAPSAGPLLTSPEFQQLLPTQSGSTPLLRTIRTDGRHFRLYTRQFSTPAGQYILAVLFSPHATEEFLESIRHALLLIIPLGALLAGTGGYFLARRALAPVVTMSEQASRIDATKLDDRLMVANEHDELGLLAQSFNRLLDRLAHSIDQQRRFMADASHELRTPVAILRGEADVALSKPERSPAEYRDSLQVLRDEARSLSQIVENLFTLTRADAGNYPLTKTRFYLDELISDCVRATRALAGAKQIQMELTTEQELMMEADEALIRRLLLNLIDNAIKFTAVGGSVSIRAGREQSALVVAVRDTGSGIPLDLQPRVFERFFRADKARTHNVETGTGAGLGLAISRWIAEVHGGELVLSSSDQQGSTFSARLPADK